MNSPTGNTAFSLRQIERDVRIACAFLTRLPVPFPREADGSITQRSLAQACWAFPVVGLIVGAIGALVLAGADALGLPPLASAVLAVLATVMATGGLHEDGLADVADGFGGGHERERKLEIMKDSRVGSYGVLALCFSVLLRSAAVTTLLEWDRGEIASGAMAVFVAAHVLARGSAPLIMSHLPLARSYGLAVHASKPSLLRSYSAWLLAMALALTLLPFVSWLAVVITVLIAAALLSWISLRQIKGYSGDVLGTQVQLGEAVVYLTVLAVMA